MKTSVCVPLIRPESPTGASANRCSLFQLTLRRTLFVCKGAATERSLWRLRRARRTLRPMPARDRGGRGRIYCGFTIIRRDVRAIRKVGRVAMCFWSIWRNYSGPAVSWRPLTGWSLMCCTIHVAVCVRAGPTAMPTARRTTVISMGLMRTASGSWSFAERSEKNSARILLS